MPTEADTCRKLAVPKLQAAGWDNAPHSIAAQAGKPDADPFDRLCHLVFNAPLLTRCQRAESAGLVMANSTRIGRSCSMKIIEDVRRYAAERGVSEEAALKKGMEAKSKGFVEKGAEVYEKA